MKKYDKIPLIVIIIVAILGIAWLCDLFQTVTGIGMMILVPIILLVIVLRKPLYAIVSGPIVPISPAEEESRKKTSSFGSKAWLVISGMIFCAALFFGATGNMKNAVTYTALGAAVLGFRWFLKEK